MMHSVRSKITLTYIVISVLGILLTGWIAYRQIQHDQFQAIVHQLENHLSEVQTVIEHVDREQGADGILIALLHDLSRSSGIRITLVDAVGNVLYESQVADSLLSTLENHLGRPEIAQAQSNGFGVATRFSQTTQLPMAYVARRISLPAPPRHFPNLAYIRAAMSMSEVDAIQRRLRLSVIASALVTLVIVGVVSIFISKQISRPIEEMATVIGEVKAGNYLAAVHLRSHDEIGRFAKLLNEMVAHLHDDAVELEKLQTVRRQFLANVSHELRTPLFSLKGFLETLLSGGLQDTSINHRFLEKAYAQANRLDQLLTDLIDISKIESGEMKPSLRFFSVRDLIEAAVQEHTEQAARKQQTLTASLPSQNVNVLGDKDLLRQVMRNLLDNAIKYSHEGSTIQVSVNEGRDEVTIEVRDNGPGIPSEHLSRIFERFYRVDANRSRELGGTGLGLAIVKHIVEAHGSRMMVTSDLGKGSAFSFALKKST